jgi:hypothetical protein
MRQRIAIYIDYALRTPSFATAYTALKQYMFEIVEEQFEIEAEVEGGGFVLRDFWKDESKNQDVKSFYEKKVFDISDYDNRDWKKYFYNEKHYKRFIEDYSYNLYVDAEVCCKRDIELLNIAQKHLFDVVLIDEYLIERKKANTMFYLSKVRVNPYSIIFLPEGTALEQSEYLGVWNPKQNSEQENKDGLGGFENWLMELEQTIKNGQST